MEACFLAQCWKPASPVEEGERLPQEPGGEGVRGLPQGKQHLLSVLRSHGELYLQLTESQTELVQILGATETLLFANGN